MRTAEKQLPAQVQEQLREVENIERAIKYHLETNAKRGPKPIHIPTPFIWFCADDEGDLNETVRVFTEAIGRKSRGNKRIGKLALYADLTKYFLLLKRHGVTLPRNKSLSKKACQYGLGEILRRHRCTVLSDNMIMKSGDERNKIAARMDRVFSRVADVIENTPA